MALIVRMVLAYLAGLIVLAVSNFVGVGEGFAEAMFFIALIGGAISLPIFAVALVLVLIFAEWVEGNLLTFVIGGPVLVCVAWMALTGTDFVAGIALATGTASAVFAAFSLIEWPRMHRPKS